MSAQYRPYRDEESVDGLETTSWSDNEPGSIQIYEKTTEEIPFNSANRRNLWIQVAFLVTVGLLGFLLGYFTPMHCGVHISSSSSETDSETLGHLESYFAHEDPTIMDKLMSKIDADNLLAILLEYQDSNRIPGSESDFNFAKHIQDSFHKFELDEISSTNYTFKTMLPAKPSLVQLLDKSKQSIYSNMDQEQYSHDDMRPFLPLSQANSSLITTDQIMFVNRGTKEDYAKLSSLGATEMDGKVLVIKQSFYQAHDIVINAQEAGAKAVLIFPDPDLFGSTSQFPIKLPDDAGKSHPTAWSNYGDLASFNLTSFMNGVDTSKLGLDKESKVYIPVIPISYKTAHKILRGLSGALAPREWNCFDYTLYLGPVYKEDNNFDKRDKLSIEFHNQETSLTTTTVTGTIIGSAEPDRYVIIGSRRDSLNRGILDSVSGTAVMLEIARVFGAMLKQGWRPRRTIIFNSFGAESLNLIGSSNWLETHQRLLHSRAVAYINCDLVVTGNRSASIAASPLLYQVLYNATKEVRNPNIAEDSKNPTVYDAWTANHLLIKRPTESTGYDGYIDAELDKLSSKTTSRTPTDNHSKSSDSSEDSIGTPGTILTHFKKSASVRIRPKIRRLDLHSIYSPFFLYAGIPVVDVRYTGFQGTPHVNGTNILEDTLPTIGTKYDTLDALKQIDPHLKYHVAITEILTEILRDLSDSVFLPFNILDYAVTLKDSYTHFVSQYGKTFVTTNVDLGK